MIPNLTFIISAFVITLMAKLLTDKETNGVVAILAIITIVITLFSAATTFMEAIRVTDIIGNH